VALFSSDVPAAFTASVLATVVLTAAVSAVLVWHGLRRLLDVPRIPRPRALYWVMTFAWGLLGTACVATVMAALLLRDHKRLDGRTEIGVIRCEATAPGQVRVEVKTPTSSTAAAERYDVAGETCVVSVKEIELRPALQALGVRALVRVDGVGSVVRPAAGPSWLAPDRAGGGAGLFGLVIRRTHAASVVVPADPSRRFVVVARPGQEPVLEPSPT
jgi:hypothetical protein